MYQNGTANFTKNIEGIQYLYNTPNSYRDVAQFHRLYSAFGNAQVNQQNAQSQYVETKVEGVTQYETYGTRIIGVKNVTKQSGATTLAYMMKNQLSRHYSVVAVEVGKTDFRYFNDRRPYCVPC